jgi:amidase
VVGDDLRAALAPALERLAALLGPAETVAMAGGADLKEWSDLIAVYREGEGWRSHRDWIERCTPTLSENGGRRMRMGAEISDADMAAADIRRAAVRDRMAVLLADGAMLAVPAAPCIAPLRGGGAQSHWQVGGRADRARPDRRTGQRRDAARYCRRARPVKPAVKPAGRTT